MGPSLRIVCGDPRTHVLQVSELMVGLEELGCTRTTGEGQTLCVMSDSFNRLGTAADLVDSGDLPTVGVVKVRLTRVQPYTPLSPPDSISS